MIRPLLKVNIVLALLVVASAWLIVKRNEQAQLKQMRVLRYSPPSFVASGGRLPQGMPAAVPKSDFKNAVAHLLFSQDRNPNVNEPVEAPPAEPQMPPMPTAYGILPFGGPALILSARPGDSQHRYQEGDIVGPFRLVRFDSKRVIFEWNGKQVERAVTDLQANSSGGALEMANEAAPLNSETGLGGGAERASNADTFRIVPGVDLGGGERACQEGDQDRQGTVVDGYRKLITQTPYGVICRWLRL